MTKKSGGGTARSGGRESIYAIQAMHEEARRLASGRRDTRDGDRTHNLLLRRKAPNPEGHTSLRWHSERDLEAATRCGNTHLLIACGSASPAVRPAHASLGAGSARGCGGERGWGQATFCEPPNYISIPDNAPGEATARGFEPLRAEPNVFLVHHLSHSVTLSLLEYQGRARGAHQ